MITPALGISIVTYHADPVLLAELLHSLERAVALLRARNHETTVALTLIDNSDTAIQLHSLCARLDPAITTSIISPGRNLGYGRAHNLAITTAIAPYHLILNPDVLLDEEVLLQGLDYLDAHPDLAALSPDAVDGGGRQLYLCKTYPALLDLLLRGFAPAWLQQRFARRLQRYECRALVDAQQPAAVDLISGCFMLCRTALLQQVGGFDSRFFLYFEDFALSLALGKLGRLVYNPACRIVHYGGHAGRKGLRHVGYFASSALKFFNRHGWKLA